MREKSSSGYALLVTPGTYNDKIDNMKMGYFTEVIEVGVQLNATQTNPVTIVSSDAGGDMYTFWNPYENITKKTRNVPQGADARCVHVRGL